MGGEGIVRARGWFREFFVVLIFLVVRLVFVYFMEFSFFGVLGIGLFLAGSEDFIFGGI